MHFDNLFVSIEVYLTWLSKQHCKSIIYESFITNPIVPEKAQDK